MDVPTMQALIALLALLVTVFGGLLLAVWNQVSNQNKALGAHEVMVAKQYVTKDEHDRRITQEINGLKELLLRVERTVNSLLELNQNGRGAA